MAYRNAFFDGALVRRKELFPVRASAIDLVLLLHRLSSLIVSSAARFAVVARATGLGHGDRMSAMASVTRLATLGSLLSAVSAWALLADPGRERERESVVLLPERVAVELLPREMVEELSGQPLVWWAAGLVRGTAVPVHLDVTMFLLARTTEDGAVK